MLELEPVPKDEEGTGVLNTEEDAGNKATVGAASGRPLRDEEEDWDRVGECGEGGTDSPEGDCNSIDCTARATNGRPYSGVSDLAEQSEGTGKPVPYGDAEKTHVILSESEGSHEYSEDLGAGGGIPSVTSLRTGDSNKSWYDCHWQSFISWIRCAAHRPLAKGEPLEDGDGYSGGVTEPPTQEPRMIDQHGNALAGGPAADVSCELSGSRPGLVTEPPTQESWMTDQHGNAFAAGHARWRAEWVMVAIAFLAAGVLGVTAAFCKPYFGADEDPMELPSYHMTATQPEETFLEPDETEPKNPTIPPDRNPYDRFDFQYDHHNYLLLQNVESLPGVDVSAFQGNIDWERVAASGIRFAIVRLGYRGYGSGKLVEDEYAQANLEGAADAGLKVGAYFFSQALNEKEVDEEIQFLLEVLGEHYLDMPVILDWEIPAADARTAGKMDARSLTDLQLYFCREMEKRGYQPMVYFNWHQSEDLYLLSELEEYPFWLALYQDRMTYPWKVEMWQYSCTGRVPGIQGDVDLNVYMP